MCGIVGILSHNVGVPIDALDHATASLAHRGPDDHGTVVLRGSVGETVEVGLGNRRLAILDLSALGHQPLRDPATGNYIVYNGELYNFREIRAQLEQAGLTFTTQSDTEVILKAYGHWGEGCLEKFRGMFAFAIWDAKRSQLFAARDPMGVKPLYYYQSNNFFIFASEVHALFNTGLVPRVLDRMGLVSYLTFGSLCGPNALVENIRPLPAACCLTWQAGQTTLRQYWNALDADSALGCDGEDRDGVDLRIANLLDECVQMQLASDVPVGVFLSGGLDSSSLVAILARNGVRPATFSVVFRERDYSEAEYSRLVARRFRTDHHEITVSQSDFLSVVSPAIDSMDLPTIDGLNTYFISQQARAAGIKVALSGLGGDELFGGYSSFRTVPRMEGQARLYRCFPEPVRRVLAKLLESIAAKTDRYRKLAEFVRISDSVVHPYFLSRMLFVPALREALLNDSSRHAEHFRSAENSMRKQLKAAEKLDQINRVSYLETCWYMLNVLLRDADTMSMAHGLELRVPLLDHVLAKNILALPGSWKMDPKIPKPLLARAVLRELPPAVVRRPKQGFTLPFEHWLKGDLRPIVERTLRRIGEGPLGGLVNSRSVTAVWDDFLAGRTSWTRPWSLYVLERWCEKHAIRC